MKHVSRSLFACAAVCVLSGAFLVGCSSDDDADSATTTEAPAVTVADASDDAATEASDDAAVEDVCTVITTDEVAALVGAPVTVEEQPGGGCAFDQEDPRAATVAFATTAVSDDTDGTFNEMRVGAVGTLSDPTKEEPGIGDYSVVASGTFGGGESQQGVGLVQVGSTIVQVTVVQANGIDGATVRGLTTQALTLAASKL